MVKVSYSSAIGNLIYLTMYTRPDICQVIGIVSIFQSNHEEARWKVVKRILQYLKGTKTLVLCYHDSDMRFKEYIDVDLEGDSDECKSTYKYIYI